MISTICRRSGGRSITRTATGRYYADHFSVVYTNHVQPRAGEGLWDRIESVMRAYLASYHVWPVFILKHVLADGAAVFRL